MMLYRHTSKEFSNPKLLPNEENELTFQNLNAKY